MIGFADMRVSAGTPCSPQNTLKEDGVLYGMHYGPCDSTHQHELTAQCKRR